MRTLPSVRNLPNLNQIPSLTVISVNPISFYPVRLPDLASERTGSLCSLSNCWVPGQDLLNFVPEALRIWSTGMGRLRDKQARVFASLIPGGRVPKTEEENDHD